MVNFSKEELLKLAELSGLKLYENEIEFLTNQIKKLLEYTNELEKVKLSKEVLPIRNINVFRKDEVIKFDSSAILKQAPKTKNGFFVVPQILKHD